MGVCQTGISGVHRVRQITWHLILYSSLLSTDLVHGAETPIPSALPPPDAIYAFDPPRDYLSGKFESWARSLDRFFGDYRNYQESNDSVFQLDISHVMGYAGEPKLGLSVNLKVHLPNTEKKLQFLVETNPEQSAAVNPTKIRTDPIKKVATPVSIAAALRYEKAESERWHFSTDGGLKLEGLNSSLFTRARVSLAIPLGEWRFSVADTVFWFNNIGAGESTVIDFERPVSKALMFRSSSNATWLNNSQNFDLRQDLSFFHALDERTAVLYQTSVIGVSRPETQVSEYVVLMLYRYRIHREWMFLEIGPQVHFMRETDFRTSSLLNMRLEILFDKSR